MVWRALRCAYHPFLTKLIKQISMKFRLLHSLPTIGLRKTNRLLTTGGCLLFLLFMVQQVGKAQTCQSEKLTVRVVQINYAGTDAGGPDPRLIATATIGASSVTTACNAWDNVAMPLLLNPTIVVNTQAVTCGAALPAISVSYKAHDDNAAISNCTVQPVLGELEQTSATTPIDISTIRSLPSHSLQQIVSVGAGATKWDITFEVVWKRRRPASGSSDPWSRRGIFASTGRSRDRPRLAQDPCKPRAAPASGSVSRAAATSTRSRRTARPCAL